jgi:hypothetical protein
MIQAQGNLEIYCKNLVVKNQAQLAEENDQNCLYNMDTEEFGWLHDFKTMLNPID